MNKLDIDPLAHLLVTVGQRLALTGERAWTASEQFDPGARAARTNGSGGNRWEQDAETGEVAPVPLDPAGEAGITTDTTSLLHVRLKTLLGWIDDNASDLDRLLRDLVPTQPRNRIVACTDCGSPKPIDMKGTQRSTADEAVAGGWCASCVRLDGLLTPIETDKNGNRFYARFCRWCGGFKAEHGVVPPLELLKIRHRHGKRVSLAAVEAHCPHCKKAAREEAKRRRKAS